MDERMDDVRAVMDAAGSERAAVFGLSEGGSLATIFAAHYPERCRALVLWGAFANFSSWFPTDEKLKRFFEYVEKGWGTRECKSVRCHRINANEYDDRYFRNSAVRPCSNTR